MNTTQSNNIHYADLIDIGWWVSGTSVAYAATAFTDMQKIVILDKEDGFGKVNSNVFLNSQTLHEWNIESNYDRPKAMKVSRKATMLKRYLESLPEWSEVFAKHHKMLAALWEKEISTLLERFETIKDIFPHDRIIWPAEIAQYEPWMMQGRDPQQKIAAQFSPDGYTVDFGKLAQSFIEQAQKTREDVLEVFTNAYVDRIEKKDDLYYVTLKDGRVFAAPALYVAAGGYTPYLLKNFHAAHQEVDFYYGDGSRELSVDDFSILSIAWSFFNSHKKFLNGKVYTMQDPALPFAAVHGDPEVHNSDITRFWPTALGIPKLERYRKWGMKDYFHVFEFSMKAADALYHVLSQNNWKTFRYLTKNMLYEVPYVGQRLFLEEIKKIIPTAKMRDITKAKDSKWNRPQILNTTKSSAKGVDFGEAKFTTTDNSCIQTITPSPGATTCLGNAYTDIQTLISSFHGKYTFQKEKFEAMFGSLS
jgi:malate dehydrogenase (quinone)